MAQGLGLVWKFEHEALIGNPIFQSEYLPHPARVPLRLDPMPIYVRGDSPELAALPGGQVSGP